MNRDVYACGDKNGIKALGLTLQQPPGQLVAAAGERLAEDVGAGVAGDRAGDASRVTDDGGRLRRGGSLPRIGVGLSRFAAGLRRPAHPWPAHGS